MRSLMRFAAAAAGLLALAAAASAQSPSPSPSVSPYPLGELKPTAVVVHLAGGFYPVNRWLAYDLDGTAHFEGVMDFERGRFRSRVDFVKVARILAEAGMCTRHATLVRPATTGMDMHYYRVNVRCGMFWRTFTSGDAFEGGGVAQTRKAVMQLETIASSLKWEQADDRAGPPDGGRVYYANPVQR